MRVRMILAFVVLAATSLFAQTFRGTMLGTVTDASGRGGFRRQSGGAECEHRPGAHHGDQRRWQLQRPGAAHRHLHGDDHAERVPDLGHQRCGGGCRHRAPRGCQLKAGEVSQTVEVSGEELSQVETTSAELGGTLTAETIANLPVNGRDYTKLIYLNPGVAGSPDQISDSPGSFGTFSMNGSRGRSNNFLLDGTDMNDGYRNDPAINEAGVFGDPRPSSRSTPSPSCACSRTTKRNTAATAARWSTS